MAISAQASFATSRPAHCAARSSVQLAPRLVSRPCRIRTAATAAAVPALTEVEQQALASYKAAAKAPGKAGALECLRLAASTKSVPPEVVEGALLAVEQEAEKGPVPSIMGTWRLVFGTATKFRPFQYIPIKEDFVLDDSAKTLALESSLGPFSFFIRGVMAAWRPESGQLDFQFTQVDVHLNGNKIWTTNPKTKPKTYTFFHVGSNLACARSSAGGVALLVK